MAKGVLMQDYQGLYNLKTTTCFFSLIQTSGSKGERFSSWHGVSVILRSMRSGSLPSPFIHNR